MRCALDVHGVRIAVESDCAEALRGVRADFRYFEAPVESPGVTLRLDLADSPLAAVPARTLPLFRTGGNAVRVAGGLRYVDHRAGSALTVFDPRADAGVVRARNPELLRAAAYLFLLSRAGSRLDRMGLHRAHALALAVGDKALLFVAGSGIGKTTLGLALMGRGPNVRWLADEIPILDRSLAVRPFPLPPRLVAGSPVPWPRPPVRLTPVARMKPPEKMQLDLGAILPRVAPPLPLAAVFVCGRERGAEATRVRRIGPARMLPHLVRYVVLGRDFPHTKAFWLDLSPSGIADEARVLGSRAALAGKILASVPAYSVAMSADSVESAAAVSDAIERLLGLVLSSAPRARGEDDHDDHAGDDFGGKGGRSCSDVTGATGTC